jgi:hypothetical protein
MMSIFQHLPRGSSISAAAGRGPAICLVAPALPKLASARTPASSTPVHRCAAKQLEGGCGRSHRPRDPPFPALLRPIQGQAMRVPPWRQKCMAEVLLHPAAPCGVPPPSPSILTSNPHPLLLPVLCLLPHYREIERHLFR